MKNYFSNARAMALAQVDRGTLDRWVRSGLVTPGIDRGGRGRPRRWSFTDIVGLRVLSILTRDYGIPPRKVRKLLPLLREYTGSSSSLAALARCQLAVTGDSVVLVRTREASDLLIDLLDSPGQLLLALVPLEHVIWDLKRRMRELETSEGSERKEPSAPSARRRSG